MGDKVNLVYKFNGAGIEDGIDVFELSPMLLNVGNLITEAHKTLYPNHTDVAVNIKPFQKGSFEIDIVMFGKTATQQLLDFIRCTRGHEIREVLEFLGLVAGVPASLVTLILFLKGRAKKVEKLGSGEIRYTSESDISITVNQNIHMLFQNNKIQEALYQGLAKPLEAEGIDSVESFIKNSKDTTKVSYDKSVVEPIKIFRRSAMPDLDEVTPIENVRLLWVHPKRVSLEGEKGSWSFRICGTNDVIKTNILDEDFLERVKSGHIRLTQYDRLLIEFTEKQQLKGGTGKLTYDVFKVKEYIEHKESEYKQNALDFEEESE